MQWFPPPLAALGLAACSPAFAPQTCASDQECGHGMVCERHAQILACVRPEDAPIVIGQSAPLSGASQALGTEMKLGIELALAEQNARGGIRGRRLELAFRDDGYQPELAELATRALVAAQATGDAPKCPTTAASTEPGQPPISHSALERGPSSVLAFLGMVGTPTMVRTAPIAIETGTLFFGAFTGASTILRDQRAGSCGRFIFNVRASYAQEARATVAYFQSKGIADTRHLLSFEQSDSFGQAGYDGLLGASKVLFAPSASAPPIARFRYTRNDDLSVPRQALLATEYLAGLLGADAAPHSVGIMLTSTYGASAEFIKDVRAWQYADDAEQRTLAKATRLTLHLSNVSFVGANALSERLLSAGPVHGALGPRSLTEGVVVSQVVPNYEGNTSEVVRAYQRALTARGASPSFTSLEGYITARVFVAGLAAHEGPFEPEGLVDTFERLPALAMGLGPSAGFSADNHQYSSTVWGTGIRPDGSFSDLYVWSAGAPLEFFE